MEQGEIILYQPDEAVKLEVRLEDETVWLTQEQIADLFGTKRPAITKHLNNIYKSGELDIDSTCSILEHMGNDGKQRYTTKYYNLDVRGRTIKFFFSNSGLDESMRLYDVNILYGMRDVR